MATLEKIRSKSVLLFTVIIAALLAFILGDLFTSSRSIFAGVPTILEVGDIKIDAQEFQQRVNDESEELKRRGGELPATEVFQQQILSQMLQEKLLEEEFEKVNIPVSSNILRTIMAMDNTIADYLMAATQARAAGQSIPAEVEALIAKKEKGASLQYQSMVYGSIFSNLYMLNELDAKDMYDATYAKYKVSYLSKEYASINGDDIKITDEEIKAEWEKYKPKYKLISETRDIQYLVVDIKPSAADESAAKKAVDEAIAKLSASEGVDTIQSDANFAIEYKTLTASSSDVKAKKEYKAFFDSATVGSARLISHQGNTYVIGKILSSKTEMDSINVSVLWAQDSLVLDSALNQLKGSSIKQLAQETFKGKLGGSDSLKIELHSKESLSLAMQRSQFPISDKDVTKLIATKNGDILKDTLVVPTQDGKTNKAYYAYVVNKTTPAVKVCEIAEISYEVEPSQATIDELTSNFNKFLAENTTIEALNKNAQKAGYNLTNATITEQNISIGNRPESTSAVYWAMNANKGDISPVFSDSQNSHMLVVTVKEIYSDGYMPYTNETIKKEITETLTNKKKADKYIAELKGKKLTTLDAYMSQAQMGDSITVATVNRLRGSQITELNSAEFIAAVTSAKPGQLLDPIQGVTSVVVARLDSIEAPTLTRPYDFKEFYQQSFIGDPISILIGNREIKWNLLELYAKNDD